MTGVVNPRQSALEVPLCRHHFSRKLLALLALAGDRLRPFIFTRRHTFGLPYLLTAPSESPAVTVGEDPFPHIEVYGHGQRTLQQVPMT
jgi:hypothetical protein